MKSIHTLIRLEKREIDALKREQLQLEQKREDCITALTHLADMLRSELEAASRMPDMQQFFGDFAASNKKKQQQIDGLLMRTEQELEILNQKIRERFSELKKYEIALSNHKKREAEKNRKRETQMMDDIAIRNYIRRDEV
jgi:flagellar FliJ protein